MNWRKLNKVLKWTGILVGITLLVFAVLLIVPEEETVPPIQPRESTRYWQMSEGFKIAYTQLVGDGSLEKTPIIFLHGGPGGYVHSSIIETLTSLAVLGHDVFLYDQRGSGLSERLDSYSDINFEKHLKDLEEIISTKVGAAKVILIGHSFGANVVSHYSARYPDKIEKLIFSGPGAFRPYLQEEGHYVDLSLKYPIPDSLTFKEPYNFNQDVDNIALKPKAIVASIGALVFDKKLISDKEMDKILNTLASRFTKGMVADPANVLPEEGGGGLYAYFATNGDVLPEIRDALRKVEAPILVLQGQYEYHSFGHGYEYVDLYPNSNYRFIENAGHEIWWDQKEEYIEAIAKFVQE